MEEKQNVSRRKFLKLAGGILGVGAAACGGTAYFGMQSPANVVFPYVTCPSENGKRLLVTYESRSGATGEISARITTALCNAGYLVDLRHMPDVNAIAEYAGVIIGSPVYMGRVMGGCVNFIEKFQNELRALPSAFFGIGLTMKEDTPENRAEMADFFAPAIDALQPDVINYFGGRIALEKMPFLFRAFAKADSDGTLAEGDYRDWDAIDAWGQELSRVV